MNNADLAAMHQARLDRGREERSTFKMHDTDIVIVEEHGRCLGSSAWASSYALARFLEGWDVESYLPKGFTCMELGCGVGLPGICAAMLGASSVELTDKEEALPIAQANVAANKLSSLVEVRELDWAESPLTTTYDLVLAADVVYEVKCHQPLLRALLGSTKPGSIVLVAYKQRVASDGDFWKEV
eukprot:CAMPEP_0173402670 /NCGR_PEP_ID=MMETSP1356-20130122/54610_1 /TAXON_ID=77927 ORGANISM="Hemiselmis virescens, Strain PCC157" /NCGR_SAMPLE_ID=MMETSP1356 /ASSEMBLY_ACC=CAM_ASM_000847 /LENGTH=184 /DNA_ID=CAMNT_0014363051 /DNA_START=74 /DNA_END=624 /DNA_ORIENTATION=-